MNKNLFYSFLIEMERERERERERALLEKWGGGLFRNLNFRSRLVKWGPL